MQDGSLVALDSNGNLWQGRIDSGYWVCSSPATAQQSYGINTGLAGWTGQQNVTVPQAWQAGTGKIVWTKITE